VPFKAVTLQAAANLAPLPAIVKVGTKIIIVRETPIARAVTTTENAKRLVADTSLRTQGEASRADNIDHPTQRSKGSFMILAMARATGTARRTTVQTSMITIAAIMPPLSIVRTSIEALKPIGIGQVLMPVQMNRDHRSIIEGKAQKAINDLINESEKISVSD